MNILKNSDFVYAIGNFMADGSFYISDNNYRFEFADGSPYKNELDYSFQHISRIKSIFERLLKKELPEVKQRGNVFVLKFRDKKLASVFINLLNIKPGKKDYIVDIPEIYRNTDYEKIFWVGYLDGDGSIARHSKRIALESASPYVISSFANYLKKEGIFFSNYKSKRESGFSHVILIKSISFRDFANKVGFSHPLKSKLLESKLKIKDFFVDNKLSYKKILVNNNLIDYIKIFDDSIFIEKGVDILIKYGYKKYHRINARLSEIIPWMVQAGKDKTEILKEINCYKFKKSKGSMNSVTLPLFFGEKLLKIAKFIRIRRGNVSFSRRYVESFRENFADLIKDFQDIFNIKPTYTCKGEILFCSGVISDFFNSFIINKSKTIKS